MRRMTAGIALGLVLGLTAPVGAHHNRDVRNLDRRVRALTKITDIHRQQIRMLQEDTNDLQGQTRQMDFNGNYTGYVDAYQVIAPSVCSFGTYTAAWYNGDLTCYDN